ncbi:MAG: neutral zinc metallopeptidase, partial [bacterium]
MITVQTQFRRAAAGALLALMALVSAATAHAATTGPGDDPRRPRLRVTESDVDASNKKIAMAYGALMGMWTRELRQLGTRFRAPRILRYDGSGYTSCGRIGPSNAMYCPRNNTIYYDEVFVAGMQKLAGNAVGTDGDMAAVGIIAHEVG